MPQMRAKLMVVGVTKNSETQETVKFQPVTGKDPFPASGESDDNTYALWTPSGSCELSITNPKLLGQFEYGQKFYVDFTPADG